MTYEITGTQSMTVTGKQTTELLRIALKASQFIAADPAARSMLGTWSNGEWQFAVDKAGGATFAARNEDRTAAFVASYRTWEPAI